jgi:hypothetical protein
MPVIALTQGYVALVSRVDASLLRRYRWCAAVHPNGVYAVGRVNGRQVRMHRFILGLRPAEIGDHRNGNTLDNRRRNLRSTDAHGNAQNSRHRPGRCGARGVRFNPCGVGWQAVIRDGSGKRRALGTYDGVRWAALAYDRAARELHGEFAVLNFPKVQSYSGLDRHRLHQAGRAHRYPAVRRKAV